MVPVLCGVQVQKIYRKPDGHSPGLCQHRKDGKLVQVDPDEVQIGETIVVKPGERIPLDGTILKGFSTLDTRP